MYPTVSTLEGHTLLMLLVVHVDHSHAISVPVIDLPTGGAVCQPILRKYSSSFDFNGAGLIGAVAPLGYVHMVDTPKATYTTEAIVRYMIPDRVALFLRPWTATLVGVYGIPMAVAAVPIAFLRN